MLCFQYNSAHLIVQSARNNCILFLVKENISDRFTTGVNARKLPTYLVFIALWILVQAVYILRHTQSLDYVIVTWHYEVQNSNFVPAFKYLLAECGRWYQRISNFEFWYIPHDSKGTFDVWRLYSSIAFFFFLKKTLSLFSVVMQVYDDWRSEIKTFKSNVFIHQHSVL